MKAYRGLIDFSGVSAPGIAVEFGKSWKLIFWSKAQYVACWDLGGSVWFTPEWLETSSAEDNECYEPIMDKKLKYSRAEILECGAARARVHWHYGLCNIDYRIFNGNTTADEYYTVYPDGIAVRRLVGWPGNESDFGGNPNIWEVGEWILINGIGETPGKNLVKERAFVFQNTEGDRIELAWPMPEPFRPLCKDHPEIAEWNAYIGRISLKGRPDPFVVVPKNKSIFPYEHCTYCRKDHPQFNIFGGMSTYSHWPLYEQDDFVGWIAAGDRVGKVATHTSLCCFGHSYRPFDRPPRPTVWLLLTGATEKSSSYLSEVASSWLNPAIVEAEKVVTSGVTPYKGFRFSERAYTFKALGLEKVRFVMRPTARVVKPVLRVENWRYSGFELKLDGVPMDDNNYRWQLVQGTLIIWLNRTIEDETEFEILGVDTNST